MHAIAPCRSLVTVRAHSSLARCIRDQHLFAFFHYVCYTLYTLRPTSFEQSIYVNSSARCFIFSL